MKYLKNICQDMYFFVFWWVKKLQSNWSLINDWELRKKKKKEKKEERREEREEEGKTAMGKSNSPETQTWGTTTR